MKIKFCSSELLNHLVFSILYKAFCMLLWLKLIIYMYVLYVSKHEGLSFLFVHFYIILINKWIHSSQEKKGKNIYWFWIKKKNQREQSNIINPNNLFSCFVIFLLFVFFFVFLLAFTRFQWLPNICF